MDKSGKIVLYLLLALGLSSVTASCRIAQRAGRAAPEAPSNPPASGNVPSIDVPGVSGYVLHFDDFSDGSADDWHISSAWNVGQTDGVFYLMSSGYGGAWLPEGQNWENTLFRAGVRIHSGSLSMSINLTQSGRYLLNMRADGLYLMKESPPGSYTLLAQTGPFNMEQPHAVAMACQDGHLQVYVDRLLWMDATDSAPLTRGTVGVAALDGSQVAVGNVLVLGLSSPLPSGPLQSPPPLAAEPPAEGLAPENGGGLSIAEVEPDPAAGPPPPAEAASSGEPDLVLESLTLLPASPVAGQPMTVAVTVRNGGEAHAGAFNIRWNPEGATFVGCSWDVFGLPAGEALDMVCEYPGYPNPGAFNWGVTADADREVGESDEDNNSLSGEIVIAANPVQEPPPAPENCRAASWTSNSVTVAWDFAGGQGDLEGFSIYQGTTSLEQWTGAASRNATLGNLQAGVQYHFDVRAYNQAGESAMDACSIDVTLQ